MGIRISQAHLGDQDPLAMEIEDSHSPISRAELLSLLQHLDSAMVERCNHSLRFTAVYLDQQSLAGSALVPWLIARGACCDCEVLAIIAERWTPQEGPTRTIPDRREKPPATRSRPPTPTTRQKTSRR